MKSLQDSSSGRGKWLLIAACGVAAAVIAGKIYFDRELQSEIGLLSQLLDVKPGVTIADIGAGKGSIALAMARKVGPLGHVYATEVDPSLIANLNRMVRRNGVANLTVITGSTRETGLPENCCDALLLRGVYHHLTDPAAFDKSLLKSLKPGGQLAVVDFAPKLLLWPWRPKDVPANRGGHGIPQNILVDELTQAEFQIGRIVNDWPGGSYCVLFRKPVQTLYTMLNDN